ncbi:MAG: nucleotidyl transferase AbiEii/AbiGii toxin family protein [Acidimicrobiales bacterium]|nr:nucleotidyl transferase AbiEii/AbiGii toxin family protein [Hyphomonadaceae bacterium]RZV41141.1 MAG: nucleotidyl transferase AbiEii/AbiGii toxin family protein [Acidimicrobiales bacterium]
MAKDITNIAASVRQRLLNLSREQGRVFDVVLVAYGLERLIHRLSLSEHRERFILKGGMLVTLWTFDEGRFTRDADFLGFGDPSEKELTQVFSEILNIEVDDGLIFDTAELSAAPIREDQIYGGMRLRTTAYLLKTEIPITIDIGFGDAIAKPGHTIDYPSLLDLPASNILAYPPTTVIAEKFPTWRVQHH